MGTVIYQQLSSIASPEGKTHAIEAYIIEIPAGEEKGNSEFGHAGKELGYILEGEATLDYGGFHYVLKEGDSVSFASDIPHTLKNQGKKTLKAVWVTTPPRLFISE